MELQQSSITLEPMPDEPVYFVTLIAGLESVVADEISERVPGAHILGATRGNLFFARPEALRDALSLATIEHLMAYAGQFDGIPPDLSGLDMIADRVAETDLDAAVESHRGLHGDVARPSFRITAYRSGQHEYNSVEISAAAGAGVVERYGWDVDLESYDFDVRVYVTGDAALVGLRLSPEPLHRRGRVQHWVASLNPTVAHAMCRISEPRAGETVIDPLCGAGTILIERSRLAPPGLLLGGDLVEAPLEAAQANLRAAAVGASLVRWDARGLPLPRQSVDCVISNPPWGRRIGSHRANLHLYPGLIREISRILRPGGTAVLLTQEKHLISRLADKHPGLEIIRQLPLSLSGTSPSIYVMRRSG